MFIRAETHRKAQAHLNRRDTGGTSGRSGAIGAFREGEALAGVAPKAHSRRSRSGEAALPGAEGAFPGAEGALQGVETASSPGRNAAVDTPYRPTKEGAVSGVDGPLFKQSSPCCKARSMSEKRSSSAGFARGRA